MNRYSPLDVILELPDVRVLRALRHFDAISAADLLEVLEVPRDERTERHRYWNALTKHTKAGRVERLDYSAGSQLRLVGNRNWYRITPAGREWLARRLEGVWHLNRQLKRAA